VVTDVVTTRIFSSLNLVSTIGGPTNRSYHITDYGRSSCGGNSEVDGDTGSDASPPSACIPAADHSWCYVIRTAMRAARLTVTSWRASVGIFVGFLW
jgi:hypothetical protein